MDKENLAIKQAKEKGKKVKRFRANLRGVTDVNLFQFRLENPFA